MNIDLSEYNKIQLFVMILALGALMYCVLQYWIIDGPITQDFFNKMVQSVIALSLLIFLGQTGLGCILQFLAKLLD